MVETIFPRCRIVTAICPVETLLSRRNSLKSEDNSWKSEMNLKINKVNTNFLASMYCRERSKNNYKLLFGFAKYTIAFFRKIEICAKLVSISCEN
jgi:hypothetical protein